jgi:hypothetical protein
MACGARLEHGIVASMAEPRISGETAAIVSWLHRQALKGANVDATLEGLCAQFLAGGFDLVHHWVSVRKADLQGSFDHLTASQIAVRQSGSTSYHSIRNFAQVPYDVIVHC